MNNVDLTFAFKLHTLINVTDSKNLLVNTTIDHKSGKPTTTSIVIFDDKKEFLMITFNFQDLKEMVESMAS